MKKNKIIEFKLRVRLKEQITKSCGSDCISTSRKKLRELSSYDLYKAAVGEIVSASVSK
jgi:hypothetical protein